MYKQIYIEKLLYILLKWYNIVFIEKEIAVRRYIKYTWISLSIILLLVLSTLAGLYYIPWTGGSKDDVETIVISENQTGAEIGEALYEKGLIVSPTVFRAALRLTGAMDTLQYGPYQIPHHSSLKEIIDRLQKGKIQSITLTIPEGFTIGEIGKRIEEQGIDTQAAFMEQGKLYSPYLYMYGPKPVTYRVEGFLFPSTYEVPVGSTAADVMKMMADEMNRQLTPKMRQDIEAQGMTIFEFITLASLVEKEAKFDEDRPIIAAVFRQRLKEGMPLESCASIQYILGYPKPLITIEDTKLESPYNTYLHKGLPPGPIANPGLKSMEAVLYAPTTDYLFFVADKEGHHHFSKTYEEHLKIVDQIYEN